MDFEQEKPVTKKIPTYKDLLWPTLMALKALGGSGSVSEILEQVLSDLKLPDSILEIRPESLGYRSKFESNLAWARTYLKKAGAIDISSRGVWMITETGLKIRTEEEILDLVKRCRKEERERRKNAQSRKAENGEDDTSDDLSWEDELLGIIRDELDVDGEAFEHLCKRVLREAGFTRVEVTKRGPDGGIDGAGVLQINDVLSFRVLFQCKKYSNRSVGADDIRNFQGAVAGRADKGLFVTTGTFTKQAEQTAVSPGPPAIDLIDGIDFCNLLKKFGIGVVTEEVVKPRREFFREFNANYRSS